MKQPRVFESRRAWRQWLAKHGETATEIWVVYFKKHTGKIAIDYEATVEEALCHGWVDSVVKRLDEERYCRKFTPRRPGSVWSASNKQRVTRLIKEGRMAEAGLRTVQEAKKSGAWNREQNSPEKMAMCSELKRILEQDAKARDFYQTMSPSCQNRYKAWVCSAKKPETRERRAGEAKAMLREGVKNLLK